jgi:MraZ protein
VARSSERIAKGMLLGTYSHSLDAKGRLIVPAKLRESLGDSFVITKSLDHCLAIYPSDGWEDFIEKIETLPKISNEPARRLRRFYFGNSQTIEVDKQGRVLIPGNLRDYAGLKKDVTLIGVNDHVEVWDDEAWQKYNDDIDINEIVDNLNELEL